MAAACEAVYIRGRCASWSCATHACAMPRHSDALDCACLRRCVAEAAQRAPRLRAALPYLHPLQSAAEHEAFGVLAACRIVHKEILPLVSLYEHALQVYGELCKSLQHTNTASVLRMFPDYNARVVALRAHAEHFAVDMQTAMHVQAIDFWLRYVLAELGAAGEGTSIMSDLLSPKKIPWFQPPYAKLVDSFGLVVHETGRQATIARAVRSRLLLAFAMGTHARLGRTSALQDLDSDLVNLILGACTASACTHDAGSAFSPVGAAVRWGLG